MTETNTESPVLDPTSRNSNYDGNIYNSYFKVLMDPEVIIIQQFAPVLGDGDSIFLKTHEGRTDVFIITKRDPKTIVRDVAVAESNFRVFLKNMESMDVPDYEFHIIKNEGQPSDSSYKKIYPLANPKSVHIATYAIQTGPSWPSPTKRAISSLF